MVLFFSNVKIVRLTKNGGSVFRRLSPRQKNVVKLTPQEQQFVVEILLNPPEFSQALMKAVRIYKEKFKKGSSDARE